MHWALERSHYVQGISHTHHLLLITPESYLEASSGVNLSIKIDSYPLTRAVQPLKEK